MQNFEHWERSLESAWGITAKISSLDGELDLNLKATCSDGRLYLLKVMRPFCDVSLVQMQCEALSHIHDRPHRCKVSSVVPSLLGDNYITLSDETGTERLAWVLSFIDGVRYAEFKPKTEPLVSHIGTSLAQLHIALDGFEHDHLQREFKWNLLQASWICEKLPVIADKNRRALLSSIMAEYHQLTSRVKALPTVAIHGDINDYNLLVSASITEKPSISGIIDFGDMCAGPRVCDIAIAGAYIMLDHPQPEHALCSLVSAYHSILPLSAEELDLIYPLLRSRMAVSVVNSTIESIANPDDPYVVISQAPAWRLLENTKLVHALVTPRLRIACGLSLSSTASNVHEFLNNNVRGTCANIISSELLKYSEDNVSTLDLSVQGSSVPQNPFNLNQSEASSIGANVDATCRARLGFYGEPRLIYTDKAFKKGNFKASNRRTVHLGIDVFAPAKTPISAPLDSVVCVVENLTTHLDYGGMVVLQHTIPTGDSFYSLYGHLDPDVCNTLHIGQNIVAGQHFATLGSTENNGGWAPHLHLQLAMNIDALRPDWTGVADPDEFVFWKAMCPNPAVLLNLSDDDVAYLPIDEAAVLQQRSDDFASNLALSYTRPVMFLRGWKQHLFDQWGRPYLDVYNNVPHVGHAHPSIQSVVSEQLKRLNTNTRYLSPAPSAFAEKLKKRLPSELSVCYFVNSGSEANELALRLSRATTHGRDMITPNHGYHGNTTGAVDISAYKFNAPGGSGQPDWVQLIDIPDVYAGTYRTPDTNCADCYADQVDSAIENIAASGGQLAGFIAETFPSVGGQVIPPKGYLQQVYARIRAAGGVCIADEVQTGLGRLGEYYFAFEQQEVVPDIVVLGKPIGNGHPIGVVITTQKIAADFARGPEYFSTFGGSTLSCVVGKTVLDIVESESLQINAAQRGRQALDGLLKLKEKHRLIGDVRGIGLFIGVALVSDRQNRLPASDAASYVVNRLRDHRVLAGLEGPYNNILKIRPPLCIEPDDITQLLNTLDSVLSETVLNS